MALGLVYMMLVRLLGWLALLPAPTPPIWSAWPAMEARTGWTAD